MAGRGESGQSPWGSPSSRAPLSQHARVLSSAHRSTQSSSFALSATATTFSPHSASAARGQAVTAVAHSGRMAGESAFGLRGPTSSQRTVPTSPRHTDHVTSSGQQPGMNHRHRAQTGTGVPHTHHTHHAHHTSGTARNSTSSFAPFPNASLHDRSQSIVPHTQFGTSRHPSFSSNAAANAPHTPFRTFSNTAQNFSPPPAHPVQPPRFSSAFTNLNLGGSSAPFGHGTSYSVGQAGAQPPFGPPGPSFYQPSNPHAQHGGHHNATRSSSNDSAFSQPVATRHAELIRSGRAENPDNLDKGVIGPKLRKDGNGRFVAIPPPDSQNPSFAEGPMPPPVPGFNGQPRPRWGQFRPQSEADEGIDDGPNTNGPAAAFLGTSLDPLPRWQAESQGGSFNPTVQEVLQHSPFIEPCRSAVPTTAAVVKIKNPPYLTSRPEILSFVGLSAKVCRQPPGSPFVAVHIITNRYNSATMDAFVELETKEDAVRLVKHFEKRTQNGKRVMMGDRECFVLLSSQEELMEEMFPRSKFTSWQGASPKVSGQVPMYYPDRPSTGFNGFFDPEELCLMAKYAEVPQRSPYANKCPIRVYETLISVLHKYPWCAPEVVLIRERDQLFDVVKKSVRALINLLRKLEHNQQQSNDQTRPTDVILKELVVAALTCPGFSEKQKVKIAADVDLAGFGHFLSSAGMGLRFGGLHQFASGWPFKALVMKPSAHPAVVEQIITFLKEAMIQADIFPLEEACAMLDQKSKFPLLDIDYSHAKTLADVASAEKRFVEGVLRLLLPSLDRTAKVKRGSAP